jgi:DNA-binding XRE family transcriptional regulator
MPKKPKIDHPVRQVRTCLGHTQPSFAKLVGCSAITIQRIENGSLKLSPKLAHTIAEATNADPLTLLQGPGRAVLDRMGKAYSKDSLKFLQNVLPMTERELAYYTQELERYLHLLLIASSRAGKFKTYGVNDALQNAFEKIAADFDLRSSIQSFLVERGHVDKHKYQVSDLRKFPDYARILGFKDKKSYKPDMVIEFTIPRGWIENYELKATPVLPHGADMKLRGDALYIIDSNRPIPPEVKEAVAQAAYWKIEHFKPLT